MKRSLTCSVAASAVLSLAAAVPISGLLHGSSAGASNAAVEAQVLALVNADRTTRGLPALAVDPGLTGIARAWSDHLLATGTLSHNLNLANQVPAQATAWGENVGLGATAQAINTAWVNSPGHYANLVGNYNFVGVGVSTRSDGTQFVTVDYELSPVALVPVATVSGPRAVAAAAAPATPCTTSNPPAAPNPTAASGYLVMGADGGMFAYGRAPFAGSLPGAHVASDPVRTALTPTQRGYWVLGRDGGVFAFGDARYVGSVPALGRSIDAVDLVPTRTGNGYWILARDGGVYSFGDARYLGSLPAVGANTEAAHLASTPSGNGYWILGSNGGVYAFGDARYAGSPAAAHVTEIPVSIASTPSGAGYWVLGAAGGVYTFGDATYRGSVPGIGCTSAWTIAIAPTSTGRGYYILAADGRLFAFGDAPMMGQPAALNVPTRDLAVTH